MSFVKLDCGIVDSSLWVERDTRSIFITALVMAEPYELTEPTAQIEVRTLSFTGWIVPPGWYGFVHAAGTGLVRRDGCEMETGLAALEELGNPDPHSRSQKHEGRRLVRVDGGYIVLNYMEHRDRDHAAADRMRKLRARRRISSPNGNHVTPNSSGVTVNSSPEPSPNGTVPPNVTQAESREQRAESIPTTKPLSPSADERAVMNHFLAKHPRRHKTPSGWRAIAKALKCGYSAADCCLAIDGNASDEWHAAKKKHGLDYVLRDGKIEDFIAAASEPAVVAIFNGPKRVNTAMQQYANIMGGHSDD